VHQRVPIPLEPSGLRDRAHPVGHDGGEILESRTQRLGDQFQEMQVVHRRQHVGAVGALLATRPDQAAYCQIAALAQGSVVFRPVRYLMPLLGDVMTTVLV
jgi:hypothetical protein